MDECRLILGDCLTAMADLPDGSVDAVVTSPPYAEQRKNTYSGIPEKDYPAWTVAWLERVRPLMAPRGSVLVNIREHRTRDGISDYVHRTRLAVREAGWHEVDELIWVKPNAVPCGNTRLPRRSWERVLWFALCGEPYCQAKDRERKSPRATDSVSLWRWGERSMCRAGRKPQPRSAYQHPRHPDIITVSTSEAYRSHPAKFPLKFARRLVELVCPPGGVVLDPFVGSGTTLLACLQTGRRGIGVELKPEYHAIALRRLEEARAALTVEAV